MVFKRATGRAHWTFQARTETGWKQLATGTTAKPLANRIEAMWESLAAEHRAWDLLNEVLAKRLSIGRLYDLWIETKATPAEMRRLLDDVNLEPLVEEFLRVHSKKVAPDTLDHIEKHVRELLPEGVPFPRSLATADKLTQFVYGYGGKRNTIRKVHSDISGFFEYLTSVKQLFPVTPMATVARPKKEKVLPRFYELDTVEAILGYQPTAQRRAFFALSYGAAIEVSVGLGLRRSDIDVETRGVRAAGTKTSTRDRVCRVADWAWVHLENYIEDMLPTVPLFPGWNRWTVSDWHRETLTGLEIEPKYPLHNARHHWAVRAARAGTPIAVIQQQLGHGSPMQTLETYAPFLPSAADREKWEKAATEYEQQRRAAK